MILFFDTETTGFPDWKLPLDHEKQPYIVQLAAQLCDEDGTVAAQFCAVVDNEVDIPEQARAVHGITRQRAARVGVSIERALDFFNGLYRNADLAVAHNMKFDQKIMDIAWARRQDRAGPAWPRSTFCTMTAAAPIVNIPPTPKMLAPKLEECIKHFFGEELPGAHDGMVDVIACRRVYFHMKSSGLI